MVQVQTTSVSSKGQVVIPREIREALGISEGVKMIIFTDGDNVLLKPIQTPKIDVFKSLIKESKKVISKSKWKKKDLHALIKKVRNESRS